MCKIIEEKKIFRVGEPELPKIEEIQIHFSKIWESKNVTNFGTYFKLFENALKEYLKVEHVIVFSNGTSALEALIAIICPQKSKVITSAFTFNATASAIVRNFLTPCFTDISRSDGNIDTNKILNVLDNQVAAILGVHCYGFPCDIEALNDISDSSGIPVIYDAAHAMGAKYQNTHLAGFGDASILSFHATKVFSCIEGGAVVTANGSLATELKKYRNFGFDEDKNAQSLLGTNSKLSELHAAVGLAQLNSLDNVLESRREIYEIYAQSLSPIAGLSMLKPRKGTFINAGYVPITLQGDKNLRDDLIKKLDKMGIHSKAYFNTNLSELTNSIGDDLRNTNHLKERILCLPIHSTMRRVDVEYIVNSIESCLQ